jgi:hypothetical protein
MLLLVTTAVAAPFLTRRASVRRIVALLVAGQATLHGALTVLAGHAGDAPAAAPGSGQGFVFDGGQTERTGSYLDQVAAMQPAGSVGAPAHGSVPGHLVEHLADQGVAMLLAHLAAVVAVGVWLAVGERALWTVLALTTTRLLDLVARAAAVLLGAWAVLVSHVRRAPYLGSTRRHVVPLPQLLDQVVARRGPPALLAA